MADNPTNSSTNNEVVKQGNNEYRRTVQHLPAFYRTDANQRFLCQYTGSFGTERFTGEARRLHR